MKQETMWPWFEGWSSKHKTRVHDIDMMDRAHQMANCTWWTELAIWRAGRFKPSSPYGELVELGRARQGELVGLDRILASLG